ncbi:unnamed protein product, partial [Polarella glacialis]
ATEVVESLDSCGDPEVVGRWMRHLERSEDPMREAAKIMSSLRLLVRQGYCLGSSGSSHVPTQSRQPPPQPSVQAHHHQVNQGHVRVPSGNIPSSPALLSTTTPGAGLVTNISTYGMPYNNSSADNPNRSSSTPYGMPYNNSSADNSNRSTSKPSSGIPIFAMGQSGPNYPSSIPARSSGSIRSDATGSERLGANFGGRRDSDTDFITEPPIDMLSLLNQLKQENVNPRSPTLQPAVSPAAPRVISGASTASTTTTSATLGTDAVAKVNGGQAIDLFRHLDQGSGARDLSKVALKQNKMPPEQNLAVDKDTWMAEMFGLPVDAEGSAPYQ